MLTWRKRSKLTIDEVSVTSFRVWPTDLDIYRHMNNGVFLTLMDLGRYDQGLRTGFWQKWQKLGWYPIVVNSTISYRKSLEPWQKFDIETKVIGWDDVAYFIEQRLKLRNPIYSETAAYGHMGRKNEIVTKTFKGPDGKIVTKEVELFTWEKLDYVPAIKKAFKIK